jgi:protoheme IX farnesyltransferase
VAVMLVALAVQTWRVRSEHGLRLAVGWTLGLTLAQAPVGIAQLLVARAGGGEAIALWRTMHLVLGVAVWGGAVLLSTLALRAPRLALRIAPASPEARPATAGTGELAGWPTDRPYTTWDRVKDYISLTKPRVITLLIFTTVASMFITPAGPPSAALVFWTFLGGWLMTSGAHSINCYLDRDIDLLMTRTRRRPLPAHQVDPERAVLFGLVLGVISFAVMAWFVNLVAAFLTLLAIAFYVVVYTILLKRTTPQNIVIGGAAGALPPVIGWAAVTGDVGMPALLLFALVFYWTPPHFWALSLRIRKDYAAAGVPMLPVVKGIAETTRQIGLYAVLMVAISLVLWAVARMGAIYLVAAITLGAIFLWQAYGLWRRGASEEASTAGAIRLYRFSISYLSLLFAAVAIDALVVIPV